MNVKTFVTAAVLGLGIVLTGATAATAASYPPATTGTFAFSASRGDNSFTVTGLDPNEPASGTVSSNGPLPTVGTLRAATRVLDFGTTDKKGTLALELVFPKGATGVYNVSITTPGGASVSGSISIKGTTVGDGVLAATGSDVPGALGWAAGAALILGIAVIVVSASRRRTSSSHE